MLKHRANPLGSYRLKDAETVVVEPETQAGKTMVPAGTWSADPAHSSVEFKVKHPAMFATVTGRFAKFGASVEAASEEPESARAVALIEAASIEPTSQPGTTTCARPASSMPQPTRRSASSRAGSSTSKTEPSESLAT